MKTVGIVAIMLSCACSAPAPVEHPKAIPLGKSDVGQIVNASMNEFFVRKDWGEWEKGDFVLLDSEWVGNYRSFGSDQSYESFDKFLANALEQTKLPPSQAKNIPPDEKQKLDAQIAALNRIQKEYKEGPNMASPSIPNLKDLTLDPRIVLQPLEKVKSLQSSGIWFAGETSIANAAGKKGKLRVYGKLDPPLFSPNGKFAILVMEWVPWSIHSAVLHFYLEKKDSGWKVVHVGEIFFV
ncbi:MAG: hypothetical protein GC165_03495 [Armatimonadetes bacterium]|nr:hypothetical protein [Armatimonadota bacterium]